MIKTALLSIHFAGNANAKNRTPKPFDQNSSRTFSLNMHETRLFIIHRSSSSGSVEAIYFSLQRAAIKIYRLFDNNEEPTRQITSQHRSEVEATIANSSILPHCDWLASSNRSKPIKMPYLRIFATVSFNLTTANISKYSAMIGLLRLDESSQSE